MSSVSTSNWANWAEQLQTSLVYWSEGRVSMCGKGLQHVVAQLEGPAMALWRALVYNQLALLSSQLGHWDYSKQQWELAQESWRNSGLQAGSADLAPTLQWFCALLKDTGFVERSEQVWQLHESGQPPLLDPWLVPATGSELPTIAAASSRSVAVAKAEAADPAYAPLGGQTLSALAQPPSHAQAPVEWDDAVGRALKLAQEGKLQPALASLDVARAHGLAARSADRGHLLALVYSAEALACFLAGDYSAATQAKEEASRLWSELRESPMIYGSDRHEKFAAALRAGEQERAADVFSGRHAQRQCPLIDPWTDLETGMQRGNWESVQLNLAKDWKSKLDAVLQHFTRGNTQEAARELGLLHQRMNLGEQQGPAGALLLQVQALTAYAGGDYDNAQALFSKAKAQWDAMPNSKRREGPFLEQTKALLTMYGLESIADHLGETLCDPFLYYKPEHQMQRMESAEPAATADEGDPRESWETQLKEAWELARSGRWEMAQRRANHAERVARLVGNDDLRVCYSLNSQAVFAQAVGNYADAESIFAETDRAWKRGAKTATARTAWSEFCDVLRETQWSELADLLQKSWDKPVSRSAYDPAVLPLECLSKTGMQVMQAAVPSVQEEDAGVLRLPTPEERKRGRTVAAPGGSKAPWLVALLVVLLLIGGGAWYALSTKAPAKSPDKPAKSAPR
jgi:hypothetical protein